MDGTPIATRVSGDTVSGNNGLFYLYTDHLGSSSFMTTSSGTVVAGSTARYKPFGGYRTQPSQTITDRGFTGHLHNDSVGLIYMNARFYLPGVGRFASADTVIPNPANPQAFNRYSYVYNNPLGYKDLDGHDPWYCSDANCVKEVLSLPKQSYVPCSADLSTCHTYGAIADFATRDVSNEEFNAMLVTIADEVDEMDPAGFSIFNPDSYSNLDQAKDERGAYDTPFYNGGGANAFNEGDFLKDKYPSNQQVCIDAIGGCYGRSEINYVAQGILSAAAGDSLGDAMIATIAWNISQYTSPPSQGKLEMTAYGWVWYKMERERNINSSIFWSGYSIPSHNDENESDKKSKNAD